MKDENVAIPFQIQRLVDGMNDKKENDHTRSNYRATLLSIQRYIENQTFMFDVEMGTVQPLKYPKGVRGEESDSQDRLDKVIESFCDKVHISIPIKKPDISNTLNRMFSVGWIDRNEYEQFYEYVNRDED